MLDIQTENRYLKTKLWIFIKSKYDYRKKMIKIGNLNHEV